VLRIRVHPRAPVNGGRPSAVKKSRCRHFVSVLCTFIFLAAATGCAAPGYWADRKRDAADIFTLTVGEGGGAKVRAGFLDVGLFYNSDFWGLRGGTTFSVPSDWRWRSLVDMVSPIPVPFITARVGHCSPWVLSSSGESFVLRTDTGAKGKRHKEYEAGMLYIPFLSLSDKAYYYTQLEVAAGLWYTVRLGLNPGELLDFLLGWTTIDIFGDDVGVLPTREDLNDVFTAAAALEKAVKEGDKAVVQAVLDRQRDLCNMTTANGLPMLYLAARFERPEVIKLLLEHGADLSARNPGGNRTALFPAAWAGNVAVAEVLIVAGADVGAKDSYGLTALQLAAEAGQKEAAELLIAHGARIDDKDMYGLTPVDRAVRWGHQDVAEAMRAAAAKQESRQKAEAKP